MIKRKHAFNRDYLTLLRLIEDVKELGATLRNTPGNDISSKRVRDNIGKKINMRNARISGLKEKLANKIKKHEKKVSQRRELVSS